jgi:Flp pilus assembly protein TadD
VSDARQLYKEGFGHFAAGRVAEAVALYRRALESDPRLPIAWNGLAMALARQGDLDGAIEAARRLVELEPEDPLSHTSLSRFYMQKGMIAEAEEERAMATRLQLKSQGGRS